MDESPRKRLARLIAGVPANSSPMPNFAVSSPPPLSAMPNAAETSPPQPSRMPNFAQPGESSRYLPPLKLPQDAPPPARGPFDFLPPYAGLKNDMTLPPFEQPGGSLPIERYMQPQAQPAPMPQAPAAPFSPPAIAQSGGQGWGGPEPAPGTVPAPYDPMNDPRYLPEHWKGAFNPRWQS